MIKEGVICHAEGPRCLGCDHYHGRAPVCVYAPRPEQQVAPTPRTDALYDDLERQAESGALRHNDVRIRKEEHARQLERELSDERQKYADLSLAYERTDAELSAAKAVAERLREAAKFRPDPRTLWVVWFEDAAVRPEVFFGDGAEEAAKAFYKQKLPSWSCHLLGRIPDAALAATRKESSNG